jgi:hypothetical protein
MKLRPIVGGFGRTLAIVLALLITAHKLPAPVEELAPTITPTAMPSTTARPIKASSKKINANRSTSSGDSNSGTAPTATALADNQQRSPRLAGKWSGSIQTVPWGPWTVALTVSADETSITQQINTEKPLTTVAQRHGEMLQARFPAGLTTITWSLTPRPDGATAQVRFQAFMNDFTAVFHRADGR